MIHLTESAARKLNELATDAGEGRAVRLFISAGGCSGLEYGMALDAPQEKDVRVEAHGATLFVEPKSFARLEDVTIDFDDGLMGKGFSFHNPHAQNTCGCGRSFS